MTAAEILALLDPSTPDMWPQGILAAADLRERRAKAAGEDCPAPWRHIDGEVVDDDGACICPPRYGTAEHIAAEADPEHVRFAVALWRGVAGRHCVGTVGPRLAYCRCCFRWPCPDLTETADEARAYLGGAS